MREWTKEEAKAIEEQNQKELERKRLEKEAELARIKKEKEAQEAIAKSEAKEEAKEAAERKKWENSKAGRICKKHPQWEDEECEYIADFRIWI